MSEILLGDGTSFDDVEKIRKQLASKEIFIFNLKESITAKTEELDTERAILTMELREEQDNLRNLKKQYDDQFKTYRKTLNDKLKNKQNKMELDEKLREEYDVIKTKWPKKVKQLTKKYEDQIPGLLEELRLEQEKNIGKQEEKVKTLSDEINTRYAKIETEIKDKKHRLELNQVQARNLERKLRNRREFAKIFAIGYGVADQLHLQPATAK